MSQTQEKAYEPDDGTVNLNFEEEAAEEASTTQGHQVDEVDPRDALDASAGVGRRRRR